MALQANSLPLFGVRPASLMASSYPSPLPLPGYLDNEAATATRYATGDLVLAVAARGTIDEAAADITGGAVATFLGVLGPLSPRRQDMAPLTTGALPAAAIPNTRTTPATADGQNYSIGEDMDFGVHYYPAMPGNMFITHICSEPDDAGTPGTDVRADSDVDVFDTYGNTIARAAGAGADEVQYANNVRQHLLAQAGVGSISAGPLARSLAYVNPQLTSIVDAAFSTEPGPVNAAAGAAAGTFNPIMTVVFVDGYYF